MGVAAIVSEKHRETVRRRTYSSRFLGISSSAVNGGDSTVAGRRRPGKDVEVSLSCPAEGRRSNCPATGESAGRGFRRGTATTGTGFAEVWDRNEAKDWMAIEVNPAGFERGGDGTPSVDAWILCISLFNSPR
jgi:hypothetical protein